jgi:hypothetical protein
VDCAEMIPLLCEHFNTHTSWSTMWTVPYTASVFKLTYLQQNPIARRNHTMPRNTKVVPEATLCPNDRPCVAVKEDSCSSVRYTAPPHCD